MANLKVYKVVQTVPAENYTSVDYVQLIKAKSPAAAVRHATKRSVKVELASVEDAVALAQHGVTVQMAGDDDADTGED